MKSHPKLILLALGGTALLAAQPAFASGKPIKLEDVPAAATATIKKWMGEDTISGLVVEKDGGVTVYEAAVKGPGASSREVSVTADGKIFSTEEIIPSDQAPEAVRKAATEAAGAGRIVSFQRIVKGDVTTFEIALDRDGKASEVEFTADGKANAAGEETGEDKEGKEGKGDDDDDKKAEKSGKGKKDAKEDDEDDEDEEADKDDEDEDDDDGDDEDDEDDDDDDDEDDDDDDDDDDDEKEQK